MSLLHPGFLLAGALAALVPIVIHLLFRRRRAPIDWGAMELLRQALAAQRRRMWLEQVALLATRVALILLLGLALARPWFGAETPFVAPKARHLAVVLDDGVASGVRTTIGDPGSAALVRLRSEAADLVRAMSPGDTVSVVLAAHPARAPLATPSTDREGIARLIEETEPSFAATDLPAALALAEATGPDDDRETIVAVFSEFRRGSADLRRELPRRSGPSPRFLVGEPAVDDRADRAVGSLVVTRAVDDDSLEIAVRVRRQGPSLGPEMVRISLEGDAIEPIPPRGVRFEAGQAEASWTVSARPRALAGGERFGSIAVTIEPDALPADDAAVAGIEPRALVRVAVVARRSLGGEVEIERVPAARWLLRALAPVERPGLEVSELDPAAVDARSLREFDAIVLPRPDLLPPMAWAPLRAFVGAGGVAVVVPPAEAASPAWIDAFAESFGGEGGLGWTFARTPTPTGTPLRIAAEQPETPWLAAVRGELAELFRPVDVYRTQPIATERSGSVVVRLEDGSPFLVVDAPDGARGAVAALAVAPELGWTNLPVKPVMVPLFQELLRQGVSGSRGTATAFVGDRPEIVAPDAEELVAPSGRRVEIGADRRPDTPLGEPGWWPALDAAGRTVAGVAVRVRPEATDLAVQPAEAVRAWFGEAEVTVMGSGADLPSLLRLEREDSGWATALLVALLVLAAVETVLARRFSRGADRATRSDPGVATSMGTGVAGGRRAA